MTSRDAYPSPVSNLARGPLTAQVHLRAGGVSVVLDVSEGRIPLVTHWGADLGELSAQDAAQLTEIAASPIPQNAPDVPLRVGLLPQLSDGWLGRPGLAGSRPDGSGWAPRLVTTSVRLTDASTGETREASTADGAGSAEPSAAQAGAAPAGAAAPAAPQLLQSGAGTAVFSLFAEEAGLEVELTLELLASGILRTRAAVTNTAALAYALTDLTPALPVPLRAEEILDFAGRWTKERTSQRSRMGVGVHLRENRRGRTGPDSAHLLHLGTPGFDFEHGEIWAVHTAFSGNHRHYAERVSSGFQVIGGGELLQPGEVRLARGESVESPWLYGAYSPAGLDPIARSFHSLLRAREGHVDTARPVTLNVWEAVYFDHDLDRLTDLADRAAELGVERFVLDDGWFGGRRDDYAGLGDWVVSADVWPEGLTPLIEHVTGLGMQFGLWFEPEMVNMDSDVAREHPEWVMGPSLAALPVESRHQQVLNLSIPEAYAHVRDQMMAVLDANDIAYIKWDQNRDLIEAATRATGAAATHEQTLAAYRLMEELKQAHPGLEIEACASGGARVDLGVLEHTDRVWVSDCIDPLERQQMNRWTSQLLPFELMGSHIASGRSHTTGRLHTLGFRAASALFGHLGIEWDLAQATETELAELRAWVEYYKQWRELIFTGALHRSGGEDDPIWLTGVVAPEQDAALYELACVQRVGVAPHGRLRLPGLDPARRYRLTPRVLGERPTGLVWPAWAREDHTAASDRVAAPHTEPAALTGGVEMSGAVLSLAGIALPLIDPETAVLLEVRAID